MEALAPINTQGETFNILPWLGSDFSSKTMKASLKALVVNDAVDGESEAWLAGGTIRQKILKCDPIRHPDINNVVDVAIKFQQALGFEMQDIIPDLEHAHDVHSSLRETYLDLDILVTYCKEKFISNKLFIAWLSVLNKLGVSTRDKPDGVSFYKNGVKIDVTEGEASNFNVRTGSCRLSVDCWKLPIRITESDFVVMVSDEFLNQNLELKVIGDVSTLQDDLSNEIYIYRSIGIALGFVSKSQIEKDGKKIELSFGDSDEEIKSTREWLMMSLIDVIKYKDLDPKIQKFYDRLMYNILNWDNLDSRIQEIIVLAFQFVNHQQKSQPIPTS